MIKKISTAILCILALLVSMIPVFAETAGVTDLKCTRSGSKVILNWKNPENFENNVLYIEKNGEEETPAELGKNSSYVYQPASAGDSFVFTVKTFFSDGASADTTVKFFVRYNDTESIPDWMVQVYGAPDFGITHDESSDGNFSVYFNCEEEPADDTYYRMSRYAVVKSEKKYRMGFWFKTSGYQAGDGFTYDDVSAANSVKEVVIGDGYEDGEWYYEEQEFTSASNASKAVAVNIYSKGKIYFDNFVFEEIDESGNSVGNVFEDSFERDIGVKELSAVRTSNTAALTWTNPADGGFLYNEVYKTYDDKTTLLAELKNGENSYNADVSAGGGYKFTVRSYYEGGLYGEKTVELWRGYTNTKVIPGWGLDIWDKDTYKFRGDFGITSETACDGNYSAFFNLDHKLESMVYFCLTREVMLDTEKRYCFSYSFKTENYGEKETSRFSFFDYAINDRQKVLAGSDEYPNGEWHTVKTYYNSPAAGTKQLKIWLECYGTIWLDNIEVYEVDENDNKIGENLIVGGDNKTDGSFESDSFAQKPEKPTECNAEGGFKSIDVTWNNTGIEANKIRIYNEGNLLSEVLYSEGKTTIEGLSYGEYELEICSVSKYGTESDRVLLKADTLPYFVSKPEFSKKSILKGDLKTQINVSNDSSQSMNTALIAALYNGKMLEKIEFVSESVNSGEEKQISVTISIPDTEGKNYSVAAYVWDDFFEASKAYHDAEWLK